MAKVDVKTHLLEHSEVKVRLLGAYLNKYLSVICNDGFTRRIKIYDLFCADGLYENGREGSPLIILRGIKNVIDFRKSNKQVTIPIDCYFNDIDNSKIEKLKNVINGNTLYKESFGSIEFASNDYQNEIERLKLMLQSLKSQNQKVFIFIDPYEYKHIKASQIKTLMEYGYVEVLLWLPIQFMYRFEKKGTPEVLRDFLSELEDVGFRKESENVWEFISQLKNSFQIYMGEKLFVDTFTIEKEKGTVFCLFFFSSHIRGFEKMLETKWGIDKEEGKGWDYSGNHHTLFYEHKTNLLEEKLKSFLKEKKRSNGELYEFTLRQSFLPTHTTEILRGWQKNTDQIEVNTREGEKARNNSFYINYESYRDDYNRVLINLK